LAEELTQETFFQVFLSLHRFKGKSKIKTWIIEIAKHTCFNYFKKNPIENDIEEEENKIQQENLQSLEDYLIRVEQQKEVRQAILRLENKYREVMIYRIYYELSFQKVAKLMGISENSAKVLFYRAKAMIKVKLASGMEEDK